MPVASTRRAFQLFHVVLVLGLLAASVPGLRHALPELGEPGHLHFAFVMGLEALGAILLVIPRTVRLGGGALLVVLIPSFLAQLAHGDWQLQHLINAAGVWFVMAHGAAWGR
jgi:hypothetical protein